MAWVVGALVVSSAGCRLRAPCSMEEPCPGTQLCLPDALGNNYCMIQCNRATDGTVCGDGSTCVPTGPTLGVCYTGGPVPLGGTCDDQLDCQRGMICAIDLIRDTAECHYACEVEATMGVAVCPTPMRCIATYDGTGVCVR